MQISGAGAPAVWVLILDQSVSNPVIEATEPATTDVAARMLTNADTACEVFDRLDRESTYFEQFLLQDVRSDREEDAVYGGEVSFQKLAQSMLTTGQTASLLRLTAGEISAADDGHQGEMETVLRRCHAPLSVVADVDVRNSQQAKSATIEMSELAAAFSASLVWMEAHSLATDNLVADTTQILNFVFSALDSYTSSFGNSPWLIVTLRNGLENNVGEPFKSGLDENRIHVPLWIRGHNVHACRVQALAGSFDLLPTISELMGSAGESDASMVPPAKPHDHAAEKSTDDFSSQSLEPPLSLEPRSLAFLCGAPQMCADRVLKLRGDGWMAARTEEFLLVVADDSDARSAESESDGNDSEEPSRRLYAKPEDRFNVNDVSGTYVTAADTLARLIQ